MKKKTIAILGSTGSIGETTLEIIKKSNKFKVVLIIVNKNSSNFHLLSLGLSCQYIFNKHKKLVDPYIKRIFFLDTIERI